MKVGLQRAVKNIKATPLWLEVQGYLVTCCHGAFTS